MRRPESVVRVTGGATAGVASTVGLNVVVLGCNRPWTR
jgi:hypothetical protein